MHTGYWVGVSTGRTTTSSLPDTLSTYPILRHFLTSYPLLSPLLKLAVWYWMEQPRFYKVDQEGHIVWVVWGERNLVGTNAMSEVRQVEGDLFVGNPFSDRIYRIRL